MKIGKLGFALAAIPVLAVYVFDVMCFSRWSIICSAAITAVVSGHYSCCVHAVSHHCSLRYTGWAKKRRHIQELYTVKMVCFLAHPVLVILTVTHKHCERR